MNPLISVIIPTYQCCDRLKIALRSVLSQTYNNYEILIIDDGSEDGTKEMVKSFRDPRIYYYWQKNSGGPASPRNKGIKLAKGEWIAFLDSDDWWSSDKLENCMFYNNKQVDLIYHDMELFKNKQHFLKRKTFKTRQLKKPILTDLLLSGNIIGNSTVVVRKKFLVSAGYLNESKEFTASEDYHMWLKISKLTNKFFYLPKYLGFYFDNDQSISKKDMSIPTGNAVNEFKKFLTIKENLKLEANIKYMRGMFSYKKKNYIKAKKDFLFVLKNGNIALKFRSFIIILRMMFI